MPFEWFRVSLVARTGMGKPPPEDVGDLLGLTQEEWPAIHVSGPPWNSAGIELFTIRWAEVAGGGDDLGAFDACVQGGFIKAARWLVGRTEGVFDRIRDAGIGVEVWIDYWLLEGEREPFFRVPAEFIVACGSAGLSIFFGTS
jgi:hypothetical protein